jgi:Na+/H+-dicarboxylate symporter
MKSKFNLGLFILTAMIWGIVVGALMGKNAALFAPLGQLFMKLILMLVAPLIAMSIIAGAASLGGTKSAGKVGISCFIYYLVTTFIAVLIGLLLGNLFHIGAGIDTTHIQQVFSSEMAEGGLTPGFWETILSFIPDNPVQALVAGNILQIIFFSLFFGFGLAAMPQKQKEPILSMLEAGNAALIWMIQKVMWTAPIGVFGLMADAVGTFGYDILSLLLKFLFVYTAAMLIQTFGVYSLLIKLLSNTSPVRFITKIYEAQIVALSTSSSLVTLPATFQACEEKLEVSHETASFVLPLGATINMDGTAIYNAMTAIFFAQIFGIPLGLPEYAAITLTSTIGAIGQAGVPGPTLLVIAVLQSAHIPITGLPLIFGADRLFDMMRTAVNITGDASCAVIVDHLAFNNRKQSANKG